MRKPLLPALLFSFCAAMLASGSWSPLASMAAQDVQLKVSFVPNRAGARTTIFFGFDIWGPGHTFPSPITRLDLRLPARMGIAATTLGQHN